MFSKSWIVIFSMVVLSGCMSSQEDILGEPPMTTEDVLESVLDTRNSEAKKWSENNSLPSAQGLRQYHQESNDVHWSRRVHYVPNERLVVYVYPQKDGLGTYHPGYSIEFPLYLQMHMIMPEE